jgi:hypothetical protein
MEAFCASQVSANWSTLPQSSLDFLHQLDLPSWHPCCLENATLPLNVPPMGSVPIFDWNSAPLESFVTLLYMTVPPFVALTDLWIRIFAGLLAHLGILHMVWKSLKREERQSMKDEKRKVSWMSASIHVGTVLSAMIVMVDAQYCLNFGQGYGISLFVASLALSLPVCYRRKLFRTGSAILLICFLALHLCVDIQTRSFLFGHAPEDVALIDEGLYYSKDNPFIQRLVEAWPSDLRNYSKATPGATRWMVTGDARTGLPYVLSTTVPTALEWHRVWLETLDQEYLALDICFPPNGGHNPNHPLYLIYHGLNGGSKEGYVEDLTVSETAKGSTVVVMVARGLMDTPLQGWAVSTKRYGAKCWTRLRYWFLSDHVSHYISMLQFFHGARISDAHSAAATLKKRVVAPNQLLAGVAYSIGAIVLNNYVASYGKKCALDVGFSISGGLDTRYQQYFERSQRTWQSPIAAHARDQLVLPKWGRRILSRLGPDGLRKLVRVTSVVVRTFKKGKLRFAGSLSSRLLTS